MKKRKNKQFGSVLNVKCPTDTVMYTTTISAIAPISSRWQRNRPEDIVRVNEIAKTLGDSIDGIVYAWFNDKKLLIYDGWTRFCGAFSLYPSKDIHMILAVNYSIDESVIIAHFSQLNKAVPVPQLYTSVGSPMRRIFLESLVSHIQHTHPSFISASSRPRCPHYNRDQLIEIFDTLLPDPIDGMTHASVMDALNTTNQEFLVEYKDAPIHAKAWKHQFLLFWVPMDKLISTLRRNLHHAEEADLLIF